MRILAQEERHTLLGSGSCGLSGGEKHRVGRGSERDAEAFHPLIALPAIIPAWETDTLFTLTCS